MQSMDNGVDLIFIGYTMTPMPQIPRRGRPPKGSERIKSESLLLRLAPAEKTAFALAADIAGLPVAAWMRERLREAARRELIESGLQVPFLQLSQE